MNMALGVLGGLVVGAAVGYGVATVYKGGAGAGGGSDQVVMELDGAKYKESDLPAELRSQIYEARNEAFERVNGTLNQWALQLSLAKEKNKDAKPENLPPFDQLIEVTPPTDQEIQALYDANKARLPPDTKFEQIKPEIEKYVRNQKMTDVLRAKNEELHAKQRLRLLGQAPTPPVVQMDLASFPAKGPANAAYTLVEVADYLCPHCQAMAPEVDALLKDMGDKVRFIPVTFSLRPEALSGTLARGAFCARQQGDEAFWKYHLATFETGKTKGWKATDPDNKDAALEVASSTGLDKAKFEPCLSSPEAQTYVKNSLEAMHKYGVTGTPTFFMNGRKLTLSGGKPFKEIVMSSMQAASH